jgi:hypothetical protein
VEPIISPINRHDEKMGDYKPMIDGEPVRDDLGIDGDPMGDDNPMDQPHPLDLAHTVLSVNSSQEVWTPEFY